MATDAETYSQILVGAQGTLKKMKRKDYSIQSGPGHWRTRST